jgi:hypothetical protein
VANSVRLWRLLSLVGSTIVNGLCGCTYLVRLVLLHGDPHRGPKSDSAAQLGTFAKGARSDSPLDPLPNDRIGGPRMWHVTHRPLTTSNRVNDIELCRIHSRHLSAVGEHAFHIFQQSAIRKMFVNALRSVTYCLQLYLRMPTLFQVRRIQASQAAAQIIHIMGVTQMVSIRITWWAQECGANTITTSPLLAVPAMTRITGT